MIDLKPLSTVSAPAIEALLDAAFGADRKQRTAYRLREGAAAIPELSFAAVADGALVGTLQSWPVELTSSDGGQPLVMVGPVSVAPEAQGRGVGKLLMTRLINAARDRPLMMIGDPDYYDRFFGFSAAQTGGWRIDAGPVEPQRLLARLSRPIAREGLLRAARQPALTP